MIQTKIKERLNLVVKNLGFPYVDIILSIPENSDFGDYSTNIALQLSKQKSKKPYHSAMEVANAILNNFGTLDFLDRLEVAGPGFINFFIKDKTLIATLNQPFQNQLNLGPLEGLKKRVLIEYAQPNTHKEFHIGHLRNITTGESLARLLESTGSEVFRANYGSDIGLPVAKALWGVQSMPQQLEEVRGKSIKEKAKFLGQAYSKAHAAYEDDPKVKEEINEINRRIYARDPELLPLWLETRAWSLAYFDIMYSRLGVEFDSIISESEIESAGKEIVEENIGNIFEKNDGAVIFPGEKYGLHTRVFITSKGNPTYEAKELGVDRREQELFPFDEALYVVGNEQTDYFKVVIKVVELLDAKMVGKKRHIPFGFVTLTTGKMSSRLGNILTADELIQSVKQAILEQYPKNEVISNDQILEKVALSAIKFSLLKYSLSTDITFDINQSINLQGDSGTYVLYTYARTQSLLKMVKMTEFLVRPNQQKISLEEREVLRQLEYFEFFVERSAQNLQPNELCTYLLNLSKSFNLFYQKWPIIKSQEQEFRLALTKRVGEVLDRGLFLLGIESLERM